MSSMWGAGVCLMSLAKKESRGQERKWRSHILTSFPSGKWRNVSSAIDTWLDFVQRIRYVITELKTSVFIQYTGIPLLGECQPPFVRDKEEVSARANGQFV